MAQIDTYVEKLNLDDTDQLVLQETSAGLTKKVLFSSLKSSLDEKINYVGVLRQAIINGNMDISQENGTTLTALSSGDYIVDMFQVMFGGAMAFSGQQNDEVPNTDSQYSCLLDCTTIDSSIAAGDYAYIRTFIEGYNFRPYVGKTATLSFWVKADKVGVYCISFRNSGFDRSYVTEYTINNSDTWEKKSITLDFDYTGGTWDYTNSYGLSISWILACGSTYQTTADTWQAGNYFATSNQVNACDSVANNFRISQVQLNEGSSALPFEHENIGTTLAKCQRYYEEIETRYRGFSTAANQLAYYDAWYKVEKRDIPSVSVVFGGGITWSNINNDNISTSRFHRQLVSSGVDLNGYYYATNYIDARF